MSGQIIFFEKNIIDLDNTNVTLTVTDAVASNTGQTFVNFIRNRNNTSAWMTTGSTDAAGTMLDVNFGQSEDLSEIILIKNNFKAFSIQYWNGSNYINFSNSINQTTNALETNYFNFTAIATDRIRIIITETQVINEDKKLFQLILTNKLLTGRLEGWPIIKSPKHSLNKVNTRMLSGKSNIIESVGSFSVSLTVNSYKVANDLDVFEGIYFNRKPYLLWLCGGNELQFASQRIGYRLEDIYLVRPSDDYEPEYMEGVYKLGIKFSIKLQEVIR